MEDEPRILDLKGLDDALAQTPVARIKGRLVKAVGPLLEAELPGARIGALCSVDPDHLCQVVGFKGRLALLMPLVDTDGIAFGSTVETLQEALYVGVGDELIGRVVDGLGKPIDSGPDIITSAQRPISSEAPDPLLRPIISEPLTTGVRVLDGLLTLGKGQRIAIMAGSGVGKSTLLGMIARHVQADVNVVCLVGERGREVKEFLADNLGAEGLRRSVVVAVTSDRSPVLQAKAPFVATAIAEYFRDQGKDVLLMMDSLTRLAMAQRQIGLAAGEPPTTKGYTPSCFAMLPRLLERAGPGPAGGTITGIYTVLVEADDINDPIGDAVRAIADGHIMLSRKLATHNHYPAIDVLGSISRLMDRVGSAEHKHAAAQFRSLMATWDENEELIRLGAYREGSSAAVDDAIHRHPDLIDFLCQQTNECTPIDETIDWLQRVTP